MISKDDAINTLEFDDYYVIQPAQPWWDNVSFTKISGGAPVADSWDLKKVGNLGRIAPRPRGVLIAPVSIHWEGTFARAKNASEESVDSRCMSRATTRAEKSAGIWGERPGIDRLS